jgi:hypothetical protein
MYFQALTVKFISRCQVHSCYQFPLSYCHYTSLLLLFQFLVNSLLPYFTLAVVPISLPATSTHIPLPESKPKMLGR